MHLITNDYGITGTFGRICLHTLEMYTPGLPCPKTLLAWSAPPTTLSPRMPILRSKTTRCVECERGCRGGERNKHVKHARLASVKLFEMSRISLTFLCIMPSQEQGGRGLRWLQGEVTPISTIVTAATVLGQPIY